MSVDCEATELTPLRRSSQRQQRSQEPQQVSQQLEQGQSSQLNELHHSQEATSALNHLQSAADFGGYMSINNNNHPVGSDSSRADTSEPNSHQALNPKSYTMDDTKRIITRIIFDGAVLLFVGLPILFLFLWGDPYKRGFFCDDESLKHPFYESTVQSWMLYLIGMVLPIVLIGSVEFVQAKINRIPAKMKLQMFGYRIKTWIPNAYRQIGIFAFGTAAQQLTTDIAKYSIGRLRPHFFTICNPIMKDGTNCSNPINAGIYHEGFTCSRDFGGRLLKEVHLSFPSGHSSFSMFTMLYCVIYLQSRMTWRESKLLKHFIQYVLMMMAWFTCMSRISDYKHHWSDVLAGALIGLTVAIVVTNCISDLGFRRNQNGKINSVARCELGTNHTTTNN